MRRVNLLDFMYGDVQLNRDHLNSLKELLLTRVRADWKKQKIHNLTLEQLRQKKRLGIYRRVLFFEDGTCQYVAGQDYAYEMRNLVKFLIQD